MSPSSFLLLSSLRYDPVLPALFTQSTTTTTTTITTKYPPPLNTPYYLLPYHRDRLLHAAKTFNWPAASKFLEQDLSSFVQTLDSFIPDKTKPWRLRVVVSPTGECTVDANPTGVVDPVHLLVPSERGCFASVGGGGDGDGVIWRVYVDSDSDGLEPSAFTTHKTTAREGYNAVRLRVGIQSFQEPAEVLVVNPRGEVMEGSITTPYFRRRRGGSGGGGGGAGGCEWITPPLSSGGNSGTTRRYALVQGFCEEQVIKWTDLVDGEECWLSNGVRGFIRGVVVLNRPDGSSGR